MNKRLFAACLSVGMLLAGCSAKKSTTVKDGTYEETVDGRNGKVTVSITISSGKITNVEVKDNKVLVEQCSLEEDELNKETFVSWGFGSANEYDEMFGDDEE